MYRPILLGIIASFAITAVHAEDTSSVERDILKLENDWSAAYQKKDSAFLQKLYADEYLSSNSDGTTFTKAQDIAGSTTGEFRLESFALDDMKVHVYNDTAVVTGRNTLKATWKGKDISGPYRFTDVYVKRDGRWQVVATQSTPVPKK